MVCLTNAQMAVSVAQIAKRPFFARLNFCLAGGLAMLRRPPSLNALNAFEAEAQGTSLARALVLDPEVLFLDKPSPRSIGPHAAAWCRRLANSCVRGEWATVLVTHDLTEASPLCDRCVVLDAGTILQDGPPTQVFERPRTRRVAENVGTERIWDLDVRDRDDGRLV